jgi:hypothetical protein
MGAALLQQELVSAVRISVDITFECVPSLEVMIRSIDYWGDILVHITTSKLGPESLHQCKQLQNIHVIPTVKQLIAFLDGELVNAPLNKHRYQLPAVRRNTGANNEHGSCGNTRAIANTLTVRQTCEMCEGAHHLVKCRSFNNASVENR